ncbi:fructan 6-exohydrolase, partial [Tanacetum coccineum]
MITSISYMWRHNSKLHALLRDQYNQKFENITFHHLLVVFLVFALAIILPGNKPVILYTGVDNKFHQVQNLAVPKDLSDPYLRQWVKYSGNPIINVPHGIKKDDFRDPTTAWLADDGKWRMIIGSNKDNNGMAFLYQTEDFINWTRYDSPLHKVEGCGVWECPDFFPVWVDSTDGVDTSVINPIDLVKHVLKVGLLETGKDYYMIGNYIPEKELYIPKNDLTLSTLRYDYGKYYASKSFFDPVKKRRILMAWVNESHPEADAVSRGWFGIQSFPRTLWLDQNKKQLIQWPIEEIEMLYENKIALQNKKLEGGSLHEVVGITASQADVKISFKLTNLEEAEELDPSWIDPQLICSEKDASNKGKQRTFGIDHSVIESFGGGGKTCITARVYPTLAIGKDARLFAFNNGTESVVISELSAWSVLHVDLVRPITSDESLSSDKQTGFHFQPSRNWMNDPNGPMYYNGVYHIFYQYNPSGPHFSNQMHWAHSVSLDLINWTPLDLAFSPTEPFDINSCWSGSATILPGDKPVMLYTGIDSKNQQVQNLAVPKDLSDPYLREWVKYS